jgi:hypothetical protein
MCETVSFIYFLTNVMGTDSFLVQQGPVSAINVISWLETRGRTAL